LTAFGKMLNKKRTPDLRNPLFAAILVFSIILHTAVLTRLKWHINLPSTSELTFEVQLLQPEKKALPPKQVVKKKQTFHGNKTAQKPLILEKKQAPLPKTGKPVAKLSPETEKQVPKAKPLPKPSLRITSSVAESKELKDREMEDDDKVAEAAFTTPSMVPVKVPDSRAANQLPLTAAQQPAQSLSFDAEALKRVSPTDSLDAGQIAERGQQDDITKDIRRKKKTVRYRVVEQTAKGASQDPGSKVGGKSAIEGELKQRKVIFKPEPPVLNLDRDVTVTLKFTVLPNGEVDQIFPYRKAAPELEQLAMKLLRQYRFEPLFENDKIQQGVIHFSIHRSR
jgi:hypothetical protein